MNDLPFTELLPELNPVQRRMLAEWLKYNMKASDGVSAMIDELIVESE